MNFNSFVNYNSHCPICSNSLTFFMLWTDPGWTKKEKLFISNESYLFEEYLSGKKKAISFIIDDNYIKFDGSSTEKIAREYQYKYFFALCSPEGISYKKGDYNIDLFKSCYYRSTPYISLADNFIKYDGSHVNRDENFSIKDRTDPFLLKAYLISMNYEENKTLFWSYQVTPEEEALEDFLPQNPFETELPLLPSIPDLGPDNRENLISRFNSWIIMS